MEDHAATISAPSNAFAYSARHHFEISPNVQGVHFLATLPDGTSLPAWIQFDSHTATFSGQPGDSDIGMTTVRLSAKCAGFESEDYFAIMVTPGSGGPFAQALSDKKAPLPPRPAPEPVTFSIADDFGFPEIGNHVIFTATALNGCELPDWVTFDEQVGAFTVTPAYEPCSVSCIVVASDRGINCNELYTIEVELSPEGPVVSLLKDDASAEPVMDFIYATDTLFTEAGLGRILVRNATLSDGDDMPTWIRLNALTGELRGRRDGVEPRALSLAIQASDGKSAATAHLDVLAEIGLGGAALYTVIRPTPDSTSTGEIGQSNTATEAAVPQLELELAAMEEKIKDLSELVSENQILDTPSTESERQLPATENASADAVAAQTERAIQAAVAWEAEKEQNEPIDADQRTIHLSFAGDDFMFSLLNYFEAEDCDEICFSAYGESHDDLPKWLLFDEACGEFYGAPPRDTEAIVALTVTAESATVSDIFHIEMRVAFGSGQRRIDVVITSEPMAMTRSAELGMASPEPQEAPSLNEPERTELSVSKESIDRPYPPALLWRQSQPLWHEDRKRLRRHSDWNRPAGGLRSQTKSKPSSIGKRRDPVFRHK